MTFEEAKEILKDSIQDDGGLYHLGWYLSWHAGDTDAILDGNFTLKELEAIVVYAGHTF